MNNNLFKIFASNLADNGGCALKLDSQEAAAAKIAELIKNEAAESKITVHISQSLNETLRRDILKSINSSSSKNISLTDELTSNCDISITGYDYIISGSGAVALNSKNNNLSESLIPPINILISKSPEIFETLNNLFLSHAGELEGLANLTIISGPSKTADIEKKIVHGMHGPKKLFVIFF